MKKVTASISVFSLIFWIALVIIGLVWWKQSGTSIWNLSIVPLFFSIQVLLKMITRYELGEDKITVKVLVEKIEIELATVRSYSIKVQPFYKQLLLGHPSKIIHVKYNKFDDTELLSTDKAILTKLESFCLDSSLA